MDYVTYDEFTALKKEVEFLRAENNDSKVWQAKYGERIDTIYKLVEDLSSKPQKRWDTVIASFISAVIAAIVTVLATGIGK